MKFISREIKTQQMPTKATHRVDCFAKRPIKDEETGKTEVKAVRWSEERQKSVNLQTVEGRVFHNGARIA